MKNFRIFAALIIVVILSACQPAVEEATSPQETEPMETSIFQPVEATEEPGISIVSLNFWLGNDLVDSYEDPAFILLKERVDEFNSLNPGINVVLRIKEIEGPGGLLATLDTANTAAPLAAPDLVAVDLHTLAKIQESGFLQPIYSDPAAFLNADDYYSGSLEPVQDQEQITALPFGVDMLVFYTNRETIEIPPETWSDVYQTPLNIAFPAADSDALYQLSLYQSISGNLVDENEDWQINEISLLSVFDFFSEARARGQMPYQISILDTYDAVWEEFESGNYSAVVNWTSRIFGAMDEDITFSQLPTLSGDPIVPANYWYWGVTTTDEDTKTAAVSLAEFLSEPEFSLAFSKKTSLAPVRKSAFDLMEDKITAVRLKNLMIYAGEIPAENILNSIGPEMAQYTIMILKNEINNEDAAQAILDWSKK